jgi:hypothetical protein
LNIFEFHHSSEAETTSEVVSKAIAQNHVIRRRVADNKMRTAESRPHPKFVPRAGRLALGFRDAHVS